MMKKTIAKFLFGSLIFSGFLRTVESSDALQESSFETYFLDNCQKRFVNDYLEKNRPPIFEYDYVHAEWDIHFCKFDSQFVRKIFAPVPVSEWDRIFQDISDGKYSKIHMAYTYVSYMVKYPAIFEAGATYFRSMREYVLQQKESCRAKFFANK